LKRLQKTLKPIYKSKNKKVAIDKALIWNRKRKKYFIWP